MIREKDIEAKVTKWAKGHGWLSYKFVSPSQRGVPDRVFIKHGTVVFVEFKAPGKTATPLQRATIAKMLASGADVRIFDDADTAIRFLDEYY